MNDWIKTEFFECDCHTPEHLIKISYFIEEKDYYLDAQLDTYSFFERLHHGIKYFFNMDNPYGMFDCWMLIKNEGERFRTFLGNKSKEIIGQAKCCENDEKYSIRLDYEHELNYMFMSFNVSYSKNTFKRFYKTIKYIFGNHPRWYSWELSEEDITKLCDVSRLVIERNEQ